VAAYVERTVSSGVRHKRSQSTMSSFATALRSFFTWCVKTEKIERNPMVRVSQRLRPLQRWPGPTLFL